MRQKLQEFSEFLVISIDFKQPVRQQFQLLAFIDVAIVLALAQEDDVLNFVSHLQSSDWSVAFSNLAKNILFSASVQYNTIHSRNIYGTQPEESKYN